MKTAIRKSVRTTEFAKPELNPNKWYVVDAENKVLGRLASEVAKRIRGKMNPQFTPNADMGDNIIVINAEKVKILGKRIEQKEYKHHSGYPGGQKTISYKDLMIKHPERVIQLAVKRMLPKTRLGKRLFHKLKVYSGSEHPHFAQKPESLSI
ncbi:MAG TPA: 50S ribosomal protein L13 [Ignavibacteria bacterium]|nr:50S ribosomal protein L13 [Ignavibacteria bacterium]